MISNKKYSVKADLWVPEDTESRRAVCLVHGMIIHRKSLSRDSMSLAGYLCDKLNAYVIVPDYLGETEYRFPKRFSRFAEVVDLSIRYLCADYGVDDVMGFGHSMGSYVVSDAALLNDHISHLVTYGGPTDHVIKNRQKGFINYLIKYLYSFDYKVDLRNMLHYVFDKETMRYLNNVMTVDPEYRGDLFDYYLDPEIIQDAVGILTEYLAKLKAWGKPVMLMFGNYDSVVEKSLKAMPDGTRIDNIIVKHIKSASHVTPCMDSLMNMKKMDPMVLFHRNVVKARV